MSTKLYRQGDVGFVALETDKPVIAADASGNLELTYTGAGLLPAGATYSKVRLARTSVIRRGEHGGVHQLDKTDIKSGDAKMYDVIDEAAQVVARYIEVIGDSADIVHHEHATLTLPKGWYEIRIQREQYQQVQRYVAD